MKQVKEDTFFQKVLTRIVINLFMIIFCGMVINWFYVHSYMFSEEITEIKYKSKPINKVLQFIGMILDGVQNIISMIWHVVSFLTGIKQVEAPTTIVVENRTIFVPTDTEKEDFDDVEAGKYYQEENGDEEKEELPEIIYESVDQNVIDKIRKDAKEIRNSLEHLVSTRNQLKTSISELLTLFDKISKEQLKYLNISSILPKIQDDNHDISARLKQQIQEFCDKYSTANEIILFYYRQNNKLSHKSKPCIFNESITIDYKTQNLVLISKHPLKSGHFQFEPITENGSNADVIDINFYNQKSLVYSINDFKVTNAKTTLKKQMFFDKIIIKVKSTINKDSQNATIPQLHVYEPQKLHISF